MKKRNGPRVGRIFVEIGAVAAQLGGGEGRDRPEKAAGTPPEPEQGRRWVRNPARRRPVGFIGGRSPSVYPPSSYRSEVGLKAKVALIVLQGDRARALLV